jgi:hypothetical protein
MWAAGQAMGISETYEISLQGTYMVDVVLESLHIQAAVLGEVFEFLAHRQQELLG